jgi:hypothetical protein
MHFPVQQALAGAVLLALNAIIPAAHAEIDFNTLEIPKESATVLPDDGTFSNQQGTSTVEAVPDKSLGGAIFNPFLQPADPPSPAPAAIARPARPPAAPEPDSTVAFTLIVAAAGAALASWFLRRLYAPLRR